MLLAIAYIFCPLKICVNVAQPGGQPTNLRDYKAIKTLIILQPFQEDKESGWMRIVVKTSDGSSYIFDRKHLQVPWMYCLNVY